MTPLAPTNDADFARRRCFATLGEVSPMLTRDDALRHQFVEYAIGRPLPGDSMAGLSARQYDWITLKVRDLGDDRRAALLEAAESVTPRPSVDAEALADAVHVDLSPAESVEQALALCDRIGEAGHELFYALGDAALVLLAAAPGARKKDVLAEHLRERESLKPILCPDGEGDPVTQWLMLERTSARIPLETRLEFAHVPFGYHKAAALALMTKDGLRVPPDLVTIEERLSAVSDNEHSFRKPADLKRWIAEGCRVVADGTPERPDYTDEALAFFQIQWSTQNSAAAWSMTFGPGAPFRVVKARGKR